MTFQPGQSGCPTGRPKGIVDKRVVLRGLLDNHAEALIKKAIELAKGGDPVALRLCIERLLPRPKPDNSIRFDLPEGKLDSADNMLRIIEDITKAVAEGHMSIEEAEKFTAFIERQRRAFKDAEWKKQSELSDAEMKKRWAAEAK